MNIQPAPASALDRLAIKLTDAQLERDVVDIDSDLEIKLAAGPTCDLSRVPGANNWVEKNGHLPTYIANIACALVRDHGFTISHAIATAVSRVKVWAVSPNTHPDTKAKAVAAIAEWTELRAKAHAKD